MATVLVRTAIIYILFTFAIRLMGKRQVGEMQLSELITTFMLSELAINPIQDISIPITYSIIPLIFLFSMEVITSFIVTKSPLFRRIFMGAPSIIIKNGILNQKELARLRISISELLSELRLKDVSSIDEVDYAILEQNGKLSVFLKKDEASNGGIAHELIIDGALNSSSIISCGKNENWVFKQLAKRNLTLDKVFLMTIDDNNKINIIIKEEK
jgi:uncharacterized membrane protein YcaP (DUF421 family)